jgi:hypothetical protein
VETSKSFPATIGCENKRYKDVRDHFSKKTFLNLSA